MNVDLFEAYKALGQCKFVRKLHSLLIHHFKGSQLYYWNLASPELGWQKTDYFDGDIFGTYEIVPDPSKPESKPFESLSCEAKEETVLAYALDLKERQDQLYLMLELMSQEKANV